MTKQNKKNESTYPAQYETEVLLKDGSSILLRPIRLDDARSWVKFVGELSARTKYLRFHYMPEELGLEDAVRFCTVDYRDTFAFVAEVLGKAKQDIVAIGRYYRLPDSHSAEVALAIEDKYQGRGLGTNLLEQLAGAARANGIDRFQADVLDRKSTRLNSSHT